MDKEKSNWVKENWVYLGACICLVSILILSAIWLTSMVNVLQSSHRKPIDGYQLTNQLNAIELDPIELDPMFKVYKEVEETLNGQMNTWLTVFGFFGALFGLVVPLVSYLLQHRSLEDERKRVLKDASDQQISLKTEITNAKNELEVKTNDRFDVAMKEAKRLIGTAMEDAEDNVGWELVKLDVKVKERFDKIERQFAKAGEHNSINMDDEGYRRLWISAKAKNAQAQSTIAYMYAVGEGKDEAGNPISKDIAQAKKWWGLAAEQNDVLSQRNLGIIYYNEEDYKSALSWYRKAAENGDADAACDYAYMLEFGEGCDIDEPEAIRWYKKAISSGSALAKGNLGEMYEFGRGGLKKDLMEAEKLYREARGGNLTARIAKEVNKCLDRVSEKIAKRGVRVIDPS